MKNNTYYDNILRKVLTETLEERADNLMNKMNLPKLKPGKFDYVQEGETCECGGRMNEGECTECGMREGEMLETRYVTSKGGKFEKEKMPPSRQDSEWTMPGFDMESYCESYYDMDPERCQSYYDQKEYNDNRGELDERLYGRQSRLDKNKNGRLDSEDFKMLRGKKERKEGREECMECGSKWEMRENTKEKERTKEKGTETEKGRKKGRNPFRDPNPDVQENPKASTKEKTKEREKTKEKDKDGNPFKNPNRKVKERTKANNDKDIKESVLYKLEYINESALFTEEEIIDIIEGIINEENKIKKGPSPAGYVAYEKSHKGSGKEEDDYMKILSKKMTEYLKDGSKGKYDMNPKHFPKGNGQLEKMDKMAYEVSKDGDEFIDDYLRPGMQTLDYDEMHPNEEWMDDNIEGSSRTGNNQEWGNAEETDANKRLNKTRKKGAYNKAKRAAYNKAPQPVISDKPGQESGKGLHLKNESVNDKQALKLNEEFDRMKGLIGYDRKTQ